MYVKISSPHGRNQIKENPSYHIFRCLYASFSLILNFFFFFCRHYLYEQKIARLSWKLEYKDLMFVDNVEEIISPAKRKVSFSLLMKEKQVIYKSTTLKQLKVSYTQYLKIFPLKILPVPVRKLPCIRVRFFVRRLIDKLLLPNTP